MLAALLSLVVPPVCVSCREMATPGDPLCRSCRAALPWLGPVVCPRCGLPGSCRRCPARGLAYDRAWAPLAYGGPVTDLVSALKERGALNVARMMAAQIAANVPCELLADGVLVPVPADPRRRRERGFDHAGRLTAELAARARLPALLALRRAIGPRQAGAGRRDRLAAGRLSIELRVEEPPPIVILVDDVHTTGATLDACARVLRAGGAREVRAVTYGRTLPSS
jgi:ComF family protein